MAVFVAGHVGNMRQRASVREIVCGSVCGSSYLIFGCHKGGGVWELGWR